MITKQQMELIKNAYENRNCKLSTYINDDLILDISTNEIIIWTKPVILCCGFFKINTIYFTDEKVVFCADDGVDIFVKVG